MNSIGGATFAVFDVATAQALLGKRGQYDTIFVAARDGVSSEQLVRDLRPIVPATAQIKTGQQQADADSKDTQDNSKFVQYFLLGFGFIALGVGAFVIFNTLSITLAQRIRELATLRTLGASKRQIKRSVLTEGLAMGVFASVVGLVLRLRAREGPERALPAVRHRPARTASTVVKPRTIIVALALGIVVTLIASLSPARRATRIAPIAALREGATLPPRLGARRPADPDDDPRRRGRAVPGGRVRRRLPGPVDDPRRRRLPGALPRRDHDRRSPRPAARSDRRRAPHGASAVPPAGWPAATPRATPRARPPPPPRS